MKLVIIFYFHKFEFFGNYFEYIFSTYHIMIIRLVVWCYIMVNHVFSFKNDLIYYI